MAPVVAHPSSLLIRSVHVLGMALLLGGAVTTWAAVRFGTSPDSGYGRFPVRVAATYEWLFWGALGVLVLTGVGNLGALAPGIPGPGTGWGAVFAVKLAVVVGLLLGSAARTLAVARVAASATAGTPPADRLRLAYAATAGYLLFLLALAEVLAHG